MIHRKPVRSRIITEKWYFQKILNFFSYANKEIVLRRHIFNRLSYNHNHNLVITWSLSLTIILV